MSFRTGGGNKRNLYLINKDDPDGKGIPVGFVLTPEAASLIVDALNAYTRWAGFPCGECGEPYVEPCTIHPFVPDLPR